MKNIYVIISSIALCLFFVSCSHKKEAAPQAENIDVALPMVDSIVLHKTFPGTIKAFREVNLVARVNGYLTSCNYNYGDKVNKGAVLFTIESANYRDAVNQSESQLNTAKANQRYASTRYAAMKEALKSDAVSKMEVEQAKSTLDEYNAAIKSAEAALQTARTQLSYCTVRAPFNGHVSAANYDVGSYLAGEGAPVDLATIYEDDQMVAYFSIDDSGTLTKVKEMMAKENSDMDKIPLTFSDAMAHDYTAKLDYMSPQVNTSTGTVELQGLIDNKNGELQSGMFVSIDLPIDVAPHAILIHDSAIGTDQLGKYVYTVNDSNKVVYTPIQVGDLYQDSLRIVNGGLDEKARYVTKAMLKVRDGLTVNPVLTR